MNKEEDNRNVLLRKDGLYYLALIHPKYKKILEEYAEPENENACYQKICYKQIANAARDIYTLIEIDGDFRRFTKGMEPREELIRVLKFKP